jgi:TPP-dependent indolepyruvate ferredoxin oxidoreductase alpha subunit
VFVRVAKPMVGDGKPFFHHGIAAISSAAINRRQVLKLAQNNQDSAETWKQSLKI